jgi:CubicO group peptidase (beta-lactamase class C family)
MIPKPTLGEIPVKPVRLLSLLITAALLCSLLAPFAVLGNHPRVGDHFSVKEYDAFHDVLHPLEHEALPRKDFARIRANAKELVRLGQAMVKLGIPPGTAESNVEEFRKELKKFDEALTKFSRDVKDGTDSQLEASFSSVHDSFEMLVGILPRKFGPATTGPDNSSVEARIRRVEQGLLPTVLIKGDPTLSIDERMKHYKVPGLSVAVINNYKVEWARSYGVKDIETREPVSTATLFQAGSISKPVAAMIALKKVEEGKLTLDENINNKLISWKLPDNEFTAKKKVTLANLLSHTAGTTVHGFPGYAVGKNLPTLQEVLDGAAPANTAPVRVDIEPGTRVRYSGGGTTIAQVAIMDIEKKPYPQIANETVLAPLEMTNSTYSQPLPDDWRKKAASGHQTAGNLVEGKIHIYPEMSAAGLWTTPSDLAKFAIEVQLSLVGRSNKVLSKESVDKMTTSFMEGVGLGFFIEKHGNAIYFGHGGADEGFRAELLVSRDKGYGAVVMANSDNGQILREVIRGIAREYGWDEFLPAPYETVSVEEATLDGYLGRFQVNPDRVLTITREAGRLYAKPTGDPGFELLPISQTNFIRRDANTKYNFIKNATGPTDAIQIDFAGGGTQAKRISADTLVPYEILMAGKIAEAMEGYRKIKKEKPANVVVEEGRLNTLGYTLMRQNKLPEAIAVFGLNVEFYPNSWNVYDSLGEAYMKNGDKELAITNYRKSLELNPKNTGAVEALKKLEGK